MICNKEKIREAADILKSPAKLARAIDIGETSVYRWIKGTAVPDPINCLKIEKVTKGKVKARDIRPDFDFDSYIEELKSLI